MEHFWLAVEHNRNMYEKLQRKISKYLSLVLRHQPDVIGLQLDDAGWADVADLLKRMNAAGRRCTREQLETVVRENDKQRFQFNDDKTRIRATQGHSIDVELGYEEATPPDTLVHGTPEKFVELIREGGLKKMQRHHVHLHCDKSLASSVGQRRGKPVILTIDAKAMSEAGHKFFVTPNDVWLTDHVPPEFITIPEPT